MFRRSKEFPGSVEGTVKFSQETCCALEHWFEQNQEVVEQLERIDAEDEDDEDLSCGHSLDEHKEALMAVVEKMELKIN